MQWLARNWLWLVVAVPFAFMHMGHIGRHRGHRGHGPPARRDGDDPTSDLAPADTARRGTGHLH